MTGLPLTGERTVPDVPDENYWFRRHEAVYLALASRCRGVVVDAGCGEGYGADLVAATADRVLALDYDEPALRHVAARYPRVAPARVNLVALPVATGVADVVVSLQVIEHLWEQEVFVAECARVLRPGGAFLVSTPNRLTFSPGRDTPLNPFHSREFAPAELSGLLRGNGFREVELLGLHHGPRLRGLDAAHGGSLVDAQVRAAVAGTPMSPALAADVASVTVEDFVLGPGDLDGCLDIVALAG
ncbi:class I SAM-dependent methyltransferase [Pseudonocardia sp. N23]|uniref:class I SAM-dependent methyltransferase n=1 Tax=Pseudonocardia sp. N23 TaxID=1987376 RepID=UPI000C0319F0|nr:class I SAM-dependent methyltransferase [Pseudonocardia sp. N23]GAY12336.1 methyltransferase [Pseudonocardia sp. N23]